MGPKKLEDSKYSVATRLIHGESFSHDWDYSHHVVPPITASTTYRLGSVDRGAEGFGHLGTYTSDTPIYVYDRMGEPNNNMLQRALAVAEESEIAFTFASGMAAVHAALSFPLKQGAEIISHSMVYGCTYSLLKNWFPRFGVKTHFVNLTQPDSFLPFVTKNTKILYLESPANPTLELIDLEKVMEALKNVNAGRSKKDQIISIIDNTFATPWCQRPAKFGVDLIVHSLTKGISGFGVDMGGAIVTRREFFDQIFMLRKDMGGNLSSQVAWKILNYGLSTLSLRIPKQQDNATKIATFLSKHPLVEKVRYPGLSTFPQYEIARRMMRDYKGEFAPGIMVYFTLKGKTLEDSKALGAKMMDFIAQNSYSITLAVSLGQTRTLIEHPGSTTHIAYSAEEQIKNGIDPGGIRLAVGIENVEDLLADLSASLDSLK